MKKTIILIIALSFSFSAAYSASLVDKIQSLVKTKDYPEAAALIPQSIKENPDEEDYFVLYGDIYLELENLDSAVLMYKKAYTLDKDEIPVMRKYARALSLKGSYDEALKIIDAALEEDKKDVKTVLEKGLILVRKDDFEKASLEFTKAREMNKTMPEIYIALGDLYYKREIYDLARKNYVEALSLDESLIEARIKLAECYYWLANGSQDQALIDEYFNKSLLEWNRVGNEDPKNAKAFYRQGKIFYLASRPKEAAQAFDKYVKLRPNDALGRWYFAQSLADIKVQQYELAIEQLKIVKNELDSVKTKATLMMARSYYGATLQNAMDSLPDKKAEYYANALQNYNDYKAAGGPIISSDLSNIAFASFKTRDTLGGLQAFEEYFKNEPSQTGLMTYVAGVFYKRDNYEKAGYYFLKVAEALPDTSEDIPKMYYFLSTCYQKTNKYDEAKNVLTKSIKINPGYIKNYLALGDVYMAFSEKDTSKNGQRKALLDSALYYYQYVVENGLKDTTSYSSEVASALAKLMSVYIKEKNYDPIGKYAKIWTEFQPKYSYAWMYLALSYHVKNDKDNACKYYKKAIQLDKNNDPALKQYKKLDYGAAGQ